jgi:hypothetical protein
MHIPAPGQKSTKNDTTDIDINKNHFFSFCKNFKYLGTNFLPELKDSNHIKKRIDQAQQAYYALNQNLLRNNKIPIHLRLRLCNAIVVNLLLWKLGTEGRRLPQARNLPSQMSPSNAEHQDVPSKRRKDFKQRS